MNDEELYKDIKSRKMVRLCYAAPRKKMKEYIDSIVEAGYNNVIGDIKLGMIKIYFDHSEDSPLIFDGIEIQRGYWACRGRQGVIDGD